MADESKQSKQVVHERKIKMPTGLTVHMDNDVKLMLEFMMRNINSSKCIKVANAVKELAPIFFQPYIDENLSAEEKFIPLVFLPPDISQ
ncbi:MAG: hypothetical protein A2Z73_03375 [Deltaproteobacteria bacterium RBG_13_60_28]|nr:MAG: hypothetical protein A2Z73_03375 [Deltaproteobacteria bacterium RBG_13_60_28]